MFYKAVSKIKEYYKNLMQKIQICKEWLKPKLAGRKKYVLACVIALIAIFVLILISQKPANQSRQKETSISSTNTTITIPAQLVLEINEPENEEIVIIDSEKLDVEFSDLKDLIYIKKTKAKKYSILSST